VTAMAPPPPQSQPQAQPGAAGAAGAEQAQRQGQAQAQAAQRQGQVAQASASGRPPALTRRALASGTPRQLRIARGLAATACLLPGLVGMVEIASAATAPVSSPTQTYAELRAGAAAYEAKAVVAAVRRQSTAEADQALTRVSTQLGAAALLYPDRSPELYRVGDQLAARQSQLSAAVASRAIGSTAAVPAAGADLTSALTKLENPPAARSVVNAQHLLIAGGVGLAGLLGASLWLARKTRRVVNPGLVAGLLLTAGVSALGWQVLAATGTGAAVDDLAQVRADAAQSVAVEAESLATVTPDGTALQSKAKGYVDAADTLIRANSGSWTARAADPWRAFATKELTAAQLGGADLTTRQGLVSGRVADLKTLDTTLATLAREQGAGSDQRPNAWAGYGIFALSLVAGALAWTGVGRRVAEYR